MSTPVEQARRAFNAGDWTSAERLCLKAIARDAHDAEALLMLGHIHAASGQVAAAEAVLARARALAPPDAVFLTDLGAAYSLAGVDQAARAAFQAALSVEDEFPRALCGLGDIEYRQGRWDLAKALFERALKQRPEFPRALASLADLALRENRDAEAATFAASAEALNPDLPAVQLVLAELRLASEPRQAINIAERVLSNWQANAHQRASAMHVKARALEAQQQFAAAWAAFERANEMTRQAHAHFDPRAHPLSVNRLDGLLDWLRREEPGQWPRPAEDVLPAPVFLVGFPRSGTTLMGQVLGAHGDVATMEENDNFADAVQALFTDDARSWSHLSQLDVNQLRRAYWERVRRHIGRVPNSAVLVDKMPMNLLLLPLIQLLFPGARVLFALRDPRDAVTSCFKQYFEPNYATANFWSLSSSAAYYDAAMRVASEARRRLPLRIHDFRYEDLVADFDRSVGEALAFLGLPWDESVRTFSESAKVARIKTPSARAVAQGLSKAATGGWRGYAAQLAPHRSVLDRWAAEFGYPNH